jgi:hypothetical protein
MQSPEIDRFLMFFINLLLGAEPKCDFLWFTYRFRAISVFSQMSDISIDLQILASLQALGVLCFGRRD